MRSMGSSRRTGSRRTAAGQSISVHYGGGDPVAQVFAPPGQEYICAEPMTAPTNALALGDDAHPWAPAG